MEKLKEVERLEAWLKESDDYEKELLAKGIKIRKDNNLGVASLTYSIKSIRNCSLTSSCRGVVIDLQSLKVVSYSFTRFFNVNENIPTVEKFNWDSFIAEEKHDGSLVTAYFYKNGWRVATTGSPTASGPVNTYTTDRTFEDLFWDTYYSGLYPSLSKDYIYIFELCTPENIVLVQHQNYKLYLLCVRHKSSFKEVENWREHQDFIDFLKPEIVFSKGSSIEEINDYVNKLNSEKGRLNNEGLVLVDSNGNRLKQKSAIYVQVGNDNNNGFVNFEELYLNNQLDEFVSYVPIHFEKAQELKETVNAIESIVDKSVALCREIFRAPISSEDKVKRYEFLTPLKCLRYTVLEILNNDHVNYRAYIQTITIYAFKKSILLYKKDFLHGD